MPGQHTDTESAEPSVTDDSTTLFTCPCIMHIVDNTAHECHIDEEDKLSFNFGFSEGIAPKRLCFLTCGYQYIATVLRALDDASFLGKHTNLSGTREEIEQLVPSYFEDGLTLTTVMLNTNGNFDSAFEGNDPFDIDPKKTRAEHFIAFKKYVEDTGKSAFGDEWELQLDSKSRIFLSDFLAAKGEGPDALAAHRRKLKSPRMLWMNIGRTNGQKGTRRPKNKLLSTYRAESTSYPARFASTLSISFAP